MRRWRKRHSSRPTSSRFRWARTPREPRHAQPARPPSRRMAAPDRILNLLGLGTRAGSVLHGTERVREAVRNGDVHFVILAADASDNQRYKLLPLLDASGIAYTTRFERIALGI